MKLNDLKEIAKLGQLTLKIHDMGRRTKLRYIWDKNGDNIIGTKQIPYTLHQYTARCEWQAENEHFKITKKDYKELMDILTNKK